MPISLRVRLLVVACAGLAASTAALAQSLPAPRTAYELLHRVTYSQNTLLGMYDNLGGDQENGYQTVCEKCGKTNLDVWGTDFGFSTHPNEHVDSRYKISPKATALAQQGVLITLNWHQCNPVGLGSRQAVPDWAGQPEPCPFTASFTVDTNGDGTPDASLTNSVIVTQALGNQLTAAQWNDLLTDGTALNTKWKSQVDKLAALIQQFQDDNIPVLLRPYHESNIPGFWWSGILSQTSATPNNPKRLWKQLRNYFENTKGLTNIVWVWSVSYHPNYWNRVAEFYPGDDQVDVIGVDIYPPTAEGTPAFDTAWNTLKQLAPSKPIALTEVSRLPSAQELQAHKWAYVVPFGITLLKRDNMPVSENWTQICQFYSPGS